MPSTSDNAGEPQTIDKEYVDIVLSDVEIDKKFVNETGISTKIIYYCRDCNKLVKPKRVGKKFQFSCMECKGKNVSFGSESSIYKYYKIPESESEIKSEK